MKLKAWLSQPIDNSPLILFRIFFGLLMFFESFGALVTGWLSETFVDVNFTFNFLGFDFLQALVGPQIYLVYFLMGACGLFIAFGLWYRLAIICFTLLWSATYFAQKSHYNNHYYLLVLIGFIMCFLPANTYAADDVKFGIKKQQLTCPRWAVFLLMFQVAIVYFYASVAKLYPDWVIGRPMEIWFGTKNFTSPFWGENFALKLKSFFSLHQVHLFFAYAGILFDLLVVPFFLWNKWTRWLALLASLVFHLTNSAIFHVGVFPYFALAFVVFFFEKETIRKRFFPKKPRPTVAQLSTPFALPKWLIPVFSVYFALQILLPLRHHVIPGNVLWDESGHRLSWRMMLRTKSANTKFIVEDKATGEKININIYDYVKRHQVGDLITKPDLMWQFAQRLKKEYAAQGKDIAVYIDSKLSVNGRKAVPFTNTEIDVAALPWNLFGRQSWVLPDHLEKIERREPVNK